MLLLLSSPVSFAVLLYITSLPKSSWEIQLSPPSRYSSPTESAFAIDLSSLLVDLATVLLTFVNLIDLLASTCIRHDSHVDVCYLESFTMERHRPTSHQDNPPSAAFLRKKIRPGEDVVDSSHNAPSRSIFGPSEPTDVDTYSDSDSTPLRNASTTTPAHLADENVAPFLAKHNPEQYAPLGLRPFQLLEPSRANSKFCYRHRPDLKCRRQADEPSMDNLQRVCSP